MSDYRQRSEVSRLIPDEWNTVSDDLAHVLEHALEIARATSGAYDPTCGSLTKLWRKAREARSVPSLGEIKRARAGCGYKRVELRGNQLRIPPGTQLDFGGIGKGYACDEAARLLQSRGIYSFAIQAGGDIVLGDPPPAEAGWPIRLFGDEPQIFSRCALSTSGPAFQNLPTQNGNLSHILDPRSGNPLVDSTEVTVIGQRGILTDPIATALSVVGSSPDWLGQYKVEVIWEPGRPVKS